MAFKSDIEIAQATTMAPIGQIAASIGLTEDELEYYGKYKAKVDYNLLKTKYKDTPNGKLILVTAINPTPAGEGKTTTTVGLGDALHRLGKKVVIALREPSLGPVFGVKGGAAGGGYAQVTRAMPCRSTPAGSPGAAAWICTTGSFASSPTAWAAKPTVCPVRMAMTSPWPRKLWPLCACPPTFWI